MIFSFIVLSSLKDIPEVVAQIQTDNSLSSYHCIKSKKSMDALSTSACKSTKKDKPLKAKPINSPTSPHHLAETVMEEDSPQLLAKI